MQDTGLKYTPKDTAVSTFVLASNRFWKQDEEAQKQKELPDVAVF